MTTFTIFTIAWGIFIVLDLFIYLKTPSDYRQSTPMWKVLPGGGVVMYLLWRRQRG